MLATVWARVANVANTSAYIRIKQVVLIEEPGTNFSFIFISKYFLCLKNKICSAACFFKKENTVLLPFSLLKTSTLPHLDARSQHLLARVAKRSQHSEMLGAF